MSRPLRLLFVCSGNITRSPMAERLAQHLADELGVPVETRSAGPVDFVGRLAALVPPPRRNLTRYHGVLAPAHPWRREVVPDPPPPKQRRPTWMPWASLVLRVFERDPLACARCGGAMTSLALVRAGASGVLAWLGSAGEVVLHGPPARGDPGAGLS